LPEKQQNYLTKPPEAIIKLGFSNLTCDEIELGVRALKKGVDLKRK
jgi:hypothetical protein